MSQTIKTQNDVGVVVSMNNCNMECYECVDYTTCYKRKKLDQEYDKWCEEQKNIPHCLNSKVDGKQPSVQDRVYSSSSSTAVTTGFMPSIENDLRIRKLTEKECMRLMGMKDSDYKKLTVSKSQKYKQAGNSIVVQVLMGIFGELLGVDYKTKIKESIEDIKDGASKEQA